MLVLVAAAFLSTHWAARPGPALSTSAAANLLYRNGLYSWQTRTSAGLHQAIADFQEALRADPHFAAAYAGLADCYSLLPEFAGASASFAFPRAKAAAERAIALDDSLAAAHRSLAYVDFWWSRNIPAAMREFTRAIALDPKSAQTHHWYATALNQTADFRAALREMDTAEELEPGSTALIADKGLLLVDAGQVSGGLQMLRQVENAQPQFAPAHGYLAFAYRLQRNGPASLHEMRWHGELTRNVEEVSLAAAGSQGYVAGGYREMMRRMAAMEEKLVAQGRFSSYLLALEEYRLGEKERALALLTVAVENHDAAAFNIRVQPEFHSLYGDRRFAALVAKEGLSLPGP
jgi:tetratricopeptide (TPR) repeat protein